MISIALIWLARTGSDALIQTVLPQRRGHGIRGRNPPGFGNNLSDLLRIDLCQDMITYALQEIERNMAERGVNRDAPGLCFRAAHGFRAIGTIVAIYCVLVFTYKKWQTPSSAGREMRPNPFVRRAGKCP